MKINVDKRQTVCGPSPSGALTRHLIYADVYYNRGNLEVIHDTGALPLTRLNIGMVDIEKCLSGNLSA